MCKFMNVKEKRAKKMRIFLRDGVIHIKLCIPWRYKLTEIIKDLVDLL